MFSTQVSSYGSRDSQLLSRANETHKDYISEIHGIVLHNTESPVIPIAEHTSGIIIPRTELCHTKSPGNYLNSSTCRHRSNERLHSVDTDGSSKEEPVPQSSIKETLTKQFMNNKAKRYSNSSIEVSTFPNITNYAQFQTHESTNIENKYIFNTRVVEDQVSLEVNGYSSVVNDTVVSMRKVNVCSYQYCKNKNISECVYSGECSRAYYHKELKLHRKYKFVGGAMKLVNHTSDGQRANTPMQCSNLRLVSSKSQAERIVANKYLNENNTKKETELFHSQYSPILRNIRHVKIPNMSVKNIFSTLSYLLLVLSLAGLAGVRASEFPDRECCDSVPPPPPHYHSATSTTTSTPPPRHYNSSITSTHGKYL